MQYAQAKPGLALNYGSPGYGGRAAHRRRMVQAHRASRHAHVPYKGGRWSLRPLASDLDISFGAVSTYLPHLKTGRLRALG
jgi:tripartite-type tricarboxylate transporter receptor subunit TctC